MCSVNTALAPDSGEYTRLVWEFARERAGMLDSEQTLQLVTLPEHLRTLPADRWVRRYLQCAERSLTDRPVGAAELRSWLRRQRHAYSAGELPAWRAALLERLDGFTWTPDADRWESMFDQVASFTAEHGRIPARGDDAALAAWLATQRLTLRRGRLDPDRAAALAELPGWTESLDVARTRQNWEHRRGGLIRFRGERGYYPDRHSTNETEAELGQWAHHQRGLYQRGDLSTTRTAALEALPDWRWRTRDAMFDRKICELRHTLDKGPIPRDHPLYIWVGSQRLRHRDGRLTEEQSAALESLGLLGETLPDALTAA